MVQTVASAHRMIEGVMVTPLRQISDERGKVMHMLRRDWDIFNEFGEIYFSIIHSGVIKAWHLHERMILNYAVPIGKIKLVLYDDREGSATRGTLQELFVGPDNYALITIPPRVWSGFKGTGTGDSMVANCASIPHDPGEIRRRDPLDRYFGYDWALRHG